MNSPSFRESSLTLFGNEFQSPLLEEIQCHLQAFLERFIIDEGSNYEVEAKFGTFVDRGSNLRISLPVLNTCVLAPGDWYRFEADLTISQHRLANRLLNEQVAKNAASWRYQHDKTVDCFHTNEQRRRLRVSRDKESGRIIQILEKKRVADMAIHVPSSSVDIRISINTETKIQNVTEEDLKRWPRDTERFKDRLTYTFDRFLQVDLTQQGREELKHELEVEICNLPQIISNPSLPQMFLLNILDLARSLSSPP